MVSRKITLLQTPIEELYLVLFNTNGFRILDGKAFSLKYPDNESINKDKTLVCFVASNYLMCEKYISYYWQLMPSANENRFHVLHEIEENYGEPVTYNVHFFGQFLNNNLLKKGFPIFIGSLKDIEEYIKINKINFKLVSGNSNHNSLGILYGEEAKVHFHKTDNSLTSKEEFNLIEELNKKIEEANSISNKLIEKNPDDYDILSIKMSILSLKNILEEKLNLES